MPNSNSVRNQVKWGWIFFFLMGLWMIAYGIYGFTLFALQPNHWDFLSQSEEVHAYLGGVFQALGLSSVGFGFLTIFVSYFHFKNGSRGAWIAFIYYPIFFLTAIFYTWPGIAWIPLLSISLVILYFSRHMLTESTEEPG